MYSTQRYPLPTVTGADGKIIGLNGTRRRLGKSSVRSAHSPVAKHILLHGYQPMPGYVTNDLGFTSNRFYASGYTLPPPPPPKKKKGLFSGYRRRGTVIPIQAGQSRMITGPIDLGPGRFMSGLASHRYKSPTAVKRGGKIYISGIGTFRRRRLRGMGDDTSADFTDFMPDLLGPPVSAPEVISGGPASGITDVFTSGTPMPGAPNFIIGSGTAYQATPLQLAQRGVVGPATSSPSSSLPNTIASLISQGAALASRVIGPGGQVLNPQTGQVTAAPRSSGGGLFSGSSIPWGPIALGAGVLGIGALVLKKRRR